MIWRPMIFWYEPRQTGLAGRVRAAGGEFFGPAGARPVPLAERCQAETSRVVTSARLTTPPGHLGERQRPKERIKLSKRLLEKRAFDQHE